jgi:hypothetical protein
MRQRSAGDSVHQVAEKCGQDFARQHQAGNQVIPSRSQTFGESMPHGIAPCRVEIRPRCPQLLRRWRSPAGCGFEVFGFRFYSSLKKTRSISEVPAAIPLPCRPTASRLEGHDRRMQFPNRGHLRRTAVMLEVLEGEPEDIDGERLRQLSLTGLACAQLEAALRERRL